MLSPSQGAAARFGICVLQSTAGSTTAPSCEERSWSMSTVAEILKHKGYQITTVDPKMPVFQIAEILSDRRIGAVLVLDSAEQMLGIVSERDVVRSLAANGARTLAMTAGQLMTRDVQVAHP